MEKSSIDLQVEYLQRLKECPPYDTYKFLDYLKKKNKVIGENQSWLLIENCKYHSKTSGYYTAFFKPNTKYKKVTPNMLFPSEWNDLWRLYQKHSDGWEIRIKAESDRSIRTRFHVHFVEYKGII